MLALLSWPAAAKPPEPKIQASVQDAVHEIAARASLGYDFDRLLSQTDPQRRVYREVPFKRRPFDAAMAKVLGPVRLRYAVEGRKVVLYRR